MTRVLLADDDTVLCALMHDYFEQHGFQVETVHNGRSALGRAMGGTYDLFILDVMMPVLDGFEVLRQIRKRSAVPVIMLTARTAHADRVEGLNAGADDYLPKPFDPGELLARMRAVLRRTQRLEAPGDPVIECGSLQLRPDTREVRLRGEAVALTSIEFDILECLACAAGRVVSRDTLMAAVHQREANPFERSLDVHISHLRKKLGNRDEAFIHTLRGTGYMLTSRPVERPVPGDDE
jgi:two-component system response regulator CpxR